MITNSLNAFTLYKSSSLTSVMGFSTDLTSTLTNGIHTLALTRCCNFLPLPRVCIRCDELLSNYNMIGNNNKSSDLVISIPNAILALKDSSLLYNIPISLIYYQGCLI